MIIMLKKDITDGVVPIKLEGKTDCCFSLFDYITIFCFGMLAV